jgi:hypothetical protein
MAYDEDDLFDEEFDFVDEDDSELEESSNVEEETQQEDKAEKPPKPRGRSAKANNSRGGAKRGPKQESQPIENKASEAEPENKASEAEPEAKPEEPPGPPTDHVVHVYELGDFKRTINREFTDEDSIKFAEEYNRTSKPHNRHAVPVHRDEEPEPHL